MVKQLEISRWLLSFFLLFSVALVACAEQIQELSQKELSQPDKVREWLRLNASKADKKTGDDYLQMGNDYMKKKNWSAAAKVYGESAQIFPTPEAIHAHITAELRMLKIIKDREKYSDQKIQSDLNHAVALYKSSLAANDVLKSLSSNEKQSIESDIKCLTDYLEKRLVVSPCRPLLDYGLSK